MNSIFLRAKQRLLGVAVDAGTRESMFFRAHHPSKISCRARLGQAEKKRSHDFYVKIAVSVSTETFGRK
jgi:hypothetical protein